MKKSLKISIIVFVIVGIIALYLVINKGHIGTISLISMDSDSNEVIPNLSINLEKSLLSSQNNETCLVTVTIDGELVTNGIEIESSNEDVAIINKNNEVEAISDGKAEIIAKYDGFEARSKIEVITPIKTMTFTATNSVIRVGKDLQLKLKVTPSDAYIDTLKYTSSDESVATVSSDGIVTGVAPGKVTITLFDSYTETEKKVNLTIKK